MVQTRSRVPKTGSSTEVASEVEPIQLHTPATTRKRGQKSVTTPGPATIAASIQSPTPVSPALATTLSKQPSQPSEVQPSPHYKKNAAKNSKFIEELRSKWHHPTKPSNRLVHFVRTLLFQTDFLLGAYFFDWWETAIVYPVYFMAIVLVCWALFRQTLHAWDMASLVLQQYLGQ